jgi:hypothetical protein
MPYITADDGNGNIQSYLLSDFVAANPTAPIHTPSANFSFGWNGVISDYVANQAYLVPADLFAAMTAAGMPIT